MPLFEIKAELPYDAVDAVDDLLLERGDERWSVLQDVIIKKAWLVGLFTDEPALRTAWTELRPFLPPETGDEHVRPLADTDWRDSYKAHFKAWQCGRLHWVPVWEKATYPLPQDHVALWLDPGLAFGTGNHETTRLCCERLVAWAATAPREAQVVDAGCGSGILALSAARLGLSRIRGFDNDPEAVRVSRENAALNQLEQAVAFSLGDLETGLRETQADLLLANIQADVLMMFARSLLAAVAPGGTLAMSGILATEQDRVSKHFAALAPDWKLETRVLNEWCDVALIRG